jgi:hypothetical protein
MRYQKLTLVSILRDANGTDCSNGGISSKYNNAMLLVPDEMIGADGPIELLGGAVEVDSSTLPENTFVLVRREIGGMPYFHAAPYFLGKRHSCFGGNFLYYSGCGFRTISGYPIAIHDRIED